MRAIQILFGRGKLEKTVPYLGVEADGDFAGGHRVGEADLSNPSIGTTASLKHR